MTLAPNSAPDDAVVGIGLTGFTVTLPITSVNIHSNFITITEGLTLPGENLNQIELARFGILGVFVEQSKIQDNEIRGLSYGIRFAGTYSNVIESNRIYDVPGPGIYLARGRPPWFQMCSLTRTT